eukprot:Gb_39148 [translate_table: standard]
MEGVDRKKIRNICILAHVDHGKTTLADHLIAGAGGGLLHPKQAGKLRFMDYLDDEQQRDITMKRSSIALQFRDHMINLIDSPGHIDFCGEVSITARLSDGALVLVDAVEGFHIQTHEVLRQAWIEKVTPCLVLNKMDRLITELKLTPMEAYSQGSTLFTVHGYVPVAESFGFADELRRWTSGAASPQLLLSHWEMNLILSIRRQKVWRVVLCQDFSWLQQLGHCVMNPCGVSSIALQFRDHMINYCYFIPKTKMIVGKKAAGSKAKPMFVFVLESLWQVYEAALQGNEGQEMLEKVIKSMNLTIPPRDLQHKELKVVRQAVMSRLLPLSDTVLSVVIDCLPDPILAQSDRISRLLPKHEVLIDVNNDALVELDHVRRAVGACDSTASAPCVAFVSKMFAVPISVLPLKGPGGDLTSNLVEELGVGKTDAGHQECFLAFSRVFSGMLFTGQKQFVLSSLYDPLKKEFEQKHLQEAKVQCLYMMMGRGIEPVATASAGNVVAIRGLGQHTLKSATLSSTPFCWPFSRPIL